VDADGAPVISFHVNKYAKNRNDAIATSHTAARLRRLRADIGGGAHCHSRLHARRERRGAGGNGVPLERERFDAHI